MLHGELKVYVSEVGSTLGDVIICISDGGGFPVGYSWSGKKVLDYGHILQVEDRYCWRTGHMM